MSMTGVEEVNIWQAALRAVLEEQSLQQPRTSDSLEDTSM